MIRAATVNDIPALLEMGARFSEKANVAGHVGYDAESVAATLEAMIKNGHPVFVSESGAIGAISLPHAFNAAHIAAHELFWWSHGRDGMALLDALEAYCAEHCHSLTMITLEAIRPKATGRLYQRRGYAPLEHSHVKVF